MHTHLQRYYAQRRPGEYENISAKKERADDTNTLCMMLRNIFLQKQVFEISCGTAYWTEQIARTAKSIIACDYNPEILKIAKQKDFGATPVDFIEMDFYDYDGVAQHESLFGGFIWSHIPVPELSDFLQKINSYVRPGGTVVLIDNNYVEGRNRPIAEVDVLGNTYQYRKKQDGSIDVVLKNFPKESFIRKQLAGLASNISIVELQYFWLLRYTVPGL